MFAFVSNVFHISVPRAAHFIRLNLGTFTLLGSFLYITHYYNLLEIKFLLYYT